MSRSTETESLNHHADPDTRLAEIGQENRGGDVSAKDIEWLCDVLEFLWMALHAA